MPELHHLSICEVASQLRSGVLTAEALIEYAIARHDRFGGSVSAYKLWQPERARQTAKAVDQIFSAGVDLGLFQGIPISVKDLFAVNGLPTYAGSPTRLPSKFEREGPVVHALTGQLAITMGKTHTTEFGFGMHGRNFHWGTPRNPWDAHQHRVSCGSSSGAGISLLEGSAYLAFGSDSGGSVRLPASMAGVVGLKVTHGRWSLAGIVPTSATLDSPGLLARTVSDIIVAFDAIEGKSSCRAYLPQASHREAAGLKIGIVDDYFWSDCDPGVTEGVMAALDEMQAAGAKVASFDFSEARQALKISGNWDAGIVGAELHAFLSAELPDWITTLNLPAKTHIGHAMAQPVADYLRARRLLDAYGASADDRMREFDVIVFPTCPITPPTLREIEDENFTRRSGPLSARNTCIVNLLGLCALTLPVALDQAGMPVGLQIVGRARHEPHLLAIGSAFERILGSSLQRLGVAPLTGPL